MHDIISRTIYTQMFLIKSRYDDITDKIICGSVNLANVN